MQVSEINNFSELNAGMLKMPDEIRAREMRMEEDIGKIKLAVIHHLPPDKREEIFNMKQHGTVAEMSQFCERLGDNKFRKLVVRNNL